MRLTRKSQQTPFERWGGQPFFDALVEQFYVGVVTDPLLRPMYPDDLAEVRKIVGDMPILIPGIGASSSRTSLNVEDVITQIDITRQHNTAGFIIVGAFAAPTMNPPIAPPSPGFK